MQSFFKSIDLYCERTEPGLLAEPFNLVTNLAFIVAAVALMRGLSAMQEHRRGAAMLLTVLVLLIGVGSALFHSFANRLAAAADVLPIAGFVVTFFWCWVHFVYGIGVFRTTAVVAGGVATVTLGVSLLPALPVAKGYLVPLTCLLLLGGFQTYRFADRSLLVIALIFAMALTFRSIDELLCESLSIGTHFIWHLLNGVVVYRCVHAFGHAHCTRKGVRSKDGRGPATFGQA